MSKSHKPHYVPWNDRKWIFCKHPDGNCTAMGYSGICCWNSSLDICEYGQILSSEEIKASPNVGSMLNYLTFSSQED